MREMIVDLEECLKNETSTSETIELYSLMCACVCVLIVTLYTDSSPLREQYEEQAERNRQLEKELETLQVELAKKRGQRGNQTHTNSCSHLALSFVNAVGSKGLQAYDGMSQVYTCIHVFQALQYKP